MTIKIWEKTAVQEIADCRVVKVLENTCQSPFTGKDHAFYVINSVDWVNLVPITADNELVCIRQYRHGTEEITLEIPGGMVDPGEEPMVAAARECLEETGYRADNLESLGAITPNPALFPNRLHTYVAWDVSLVGEIQNTASEQTEVTLVPMSEVPDLLVRGEIDHALVAATLWRLLATT